MKYHKFVFPIFLLALISCDFSFGLPSSSLSGDSSNQSVTSSQSVSTSSSINTSWDPNVPSPVELFDYDVVSSKWGDMILLNELTCSYEERPYAIVIPEEIEGIPVRALNFEMFWAFPDGEPSGIEDDISSPCDKKIHHVILPSTLKSIGTSAFNGLSALEEIEFPSELETIYNMAFYRCHSIKNVTVPSTVTTLDHSVFCRCVSLETLEIYADITVIRDSLCNGCSSLKEVILPDQITDIERVAFAGCKSLEQIDLPSSLEYIGSGAFQNTGLTSITFPSSLKTIDSYAFCKTNLKEVYIPSGVSVDSKAFVDCMQLETIYMADTSRVNFDFGDNENVEVIYGYEGN